jgi:hypothetical protein
MSQMTFESYGVRVRISSNDAATLDGAIAVARSSLLNRITEINTETAHLTFELNRLDNGDIMLVQDGAELGTSDTELKAYRFFDSILRVSVGENAKDLVFLHAGAVSWKGRSIIMPADSFKGKSTLTTELVRAGCEYYSDDFAVLDADANLHPFPRKIARRTEDFKTYEIDIDDIGGKIGTEPLEPGIVLFTGYENGAEFTPIFETPGAGVLKLIPFTLSIRKQPEFSIGVLHKLAARAIIVSSLRGSAERFSRTLLDFVDNHVN